MYSDSLWEMFLIEQQPFSQPLEYIDYISDTSQQTTQRPEVHGCGL